MNMGNEKKLFSAMSASINDEELILATLQGMIAAEISMRRQELGLSQKELAKKLQVSQGLVSRWERGDANFTLQTLVKVCLTLGLSIQSPMVLRQAKKYISKGSNIVHPNSMNIWKGCSLSNNTGGEFKPYYPEELEEM